MTEKITIRVRERRGFVREAQGYDGWTEYQAVKGRKILYRAETRASLDEYLRTNHPSAEIIDRTAQ